VQCATIGYLAAGLQNLVEMQRSVGSDQFKDFLAIGFFDIENSPQFLWSAWPYPAIRGRTKKVPMLVFLRNKNVYNIIGLNVNQTIKSPSTSMIRDLYLEEIAVAENKLVALVLSL
jgi:hypothetical protein